MAVRLEKYVNFSWLDKLKIAVLSIHILSRLKTLSFCWGENLLQMSFFFFQLSECFILEIQF